MDKDCDLREGTWKGHTLYQCKTCHVSTLDKAVLESRCKSFQTEKPQRPLTSDTGLLGPDGRPLPEPGPEPQATGEGSDFPDYASHDDPEPSLMHRFLGRRSEGGEE